MHSRRPLIQGFEDFGVGDRVMRVPSDLLKEIESFRKFHGLKNQAMVIRIWKGAYESLQGEEVA